MLEREKEREDLARCLRFCYCCCLFRLFVRLFVCLFVCSARHKKVAQHCPNETLVSAAYIHPVCVCVCVSARGESEMSLQNMHAHLHTHLYTHRHADIYICTCLRARVGVHWNAILKRCALLPLLQQQSTSLPGLSLSAHINGPTTVATFWSTLRWSKCERAGWP